jgi:hypothetical protein
MGRQWAAGKRRPRSRVKASIAGNADSTALTHTDARPAVDVCEEDCAAYGHSPESHISIAPREGYSATKAATSTASTMRYVRLKGTAEALYRCSCVPGGAP